MISSSYRRVVLALLVAGLLASLFVALIRTRVESHARRVEIAMDYGDFIGLARSYGYDPQGFLIALRRSGLTSLAVGEELGAGVNLSTDAVVYSGQSLIDAARLTPLADRRLEALVHSGRIVPDDVYLVAYSKPSRDRYLREARLRLSAKSVRQITMAAPYVLELKTQLDFFGGLGLGIPAAGRDLAHSTGLLLIPRLQNGERFTPGEIDTIFNAALGRGPVSTMIFFGLRNQVLGFPNNLEATADAFKRAKINFGSIETYTRDQAQKGNDGLASLIINQTVRVQAISKPELEKITDLRTVVARYLLGIRERNVRVVYLRPWTHEEGDLTIEASNVLMVREIAEGLRSSGYTLGRATPIPFFKASTNRAVIALATLAAPAALLLLLALVFGIERWGIFALLAGGDLLLYMLGIAVHHEFAARKAIALGGAIIFATAAIVAVSGAFTGAQATTWRAALVRGLRYLGIGVGVSLCGALLVIGLLSHPLFMEEIDRFAGVKLVLLVPPLLALFLYIFTDRFSARITEPARALLEPVRVIHLIAGVIVIGAMALVYMRSGNQSDIAPSALELHLRSGLSALLLVRPRFKEFVVAWPLLMLVPALRRDHVAAAGWLFALGISIGFADVIDTFSHLHTSLLISILRLVNGALIGIIIGAIVIWLYRRFVSARPVRV